MTVWEKPGATDEWLTPLYIFEAMNVRFDCDVSFPAGRFGHVPSSQWCARLIDFDSLNQPWDGCVWMNPPFGRRNGIKPWLAKFIAHGHGVALVPDRTSAPWFQAAAKRCEAMLFVSPKVKFLRLDGSVGKSPSIGTVLLAIGKTGVSGLRHAECAGIGFLSIAESA